MLQQLKHASPLESSRQRRECLNLVLREESLQTTDTCNVANMYEENHADHKSVQEIRESISQEV